MWNGEGECSRLACLGSSVPIPVWWNVKWECGGVGGDMGNMEKGWGREGRIPVLLANSTSVYVLSKACTDMSLKACTHERSLGQWNPPFTILDPPLVQRGCSKVKPKHYKKEDKRGQRGFVRRS